jgi:hypothetical protein
MTAPRFNRLDLERWSELDLATTSVSSVTCSGETLMALPLIAAATCAAVMAVRPGAAAAGNAIAAKDLVRK